MLIIRSLNQYYGRYHVLKGINAEFADGQIHGIIGLNGAGKTTFFNCICGLIDYQGEIMHSGHQLLKNHIGYVPTELYFFPRTKGKEYLEFLCHARGEKNSDVSRLNIFDLPLDEFIDNYSTGMRRKIAFMGAMIGKCEIYIFDEPFNGVDIKSNLLLKREILRLKDEGKTVLLSSHIISSLTELCDDVFLIRGGSIEKKYLPTDYAEIEQDLGEA